MLVAEPTPAHRAVTRWANALIFVTVLLGAVVCATDSSSTCPAWPVCYADKVAPDLRPGLLENPAIEFVHRFISFSALVLLGFSGRMGRRSPDVRVRVFPWAALLCGVGSAVFGMMIILFHLPLALGLLDLLFALIAMVLIAVTDAALRRDRTQARQPRIARLIRTTLATLIVMHLLGSVVAGTTSAGTGSFTRCLSWPLWALPAIDRFPALQVVRIVLAAAALALIVWIVTLALRHRRLRLAALLVALATAVEVVLGVVISAGGLASTQTNGIHLPVAVAYAAAAVTIVWSLAWLLGLCRTVAKR